MEEKGSLAKKHVVFVVLAFLCSALPLASMKSTGVFFIQVQNELGATAKDASLLISLMYGMFFFAGPFASTLCNVLGYRKTLILGGLLSSTGACISCLVERIELLYITFSAMIGVGACLVNTPTYAMAGMIFTAKRPLVNNIISTGSAVVAIPLSLLVQLWIDQYTWSGSILLLGAVILHVVPFALLLTGDMESLDVNSNTINNNKTKKKRIFHLELLKSPTFLIYILSCGLHMSSVVLISVYLVRYAQSRNVSNYEAAALSSLISAVDIITRPIIGFITSQPKFGGRIIDRSFILCLAMIMQAVTTFFIPFSVDYKSIVMVTVAYAFSMGFSGALPVTVLADFFGREKLISSLGLRFFAMGVFSLVTPPLVGAFVDTASTDSKFSYPFYISSGLSIVSCSFLALVKCLRLRLSTEE